MCQRLKLNNPLYYKAKSIYEFKVEDLHGNYVKLDRYKGQICLIVNTATLSSLSKSYIREYNRLMNDYRREGLRILAFPCDQFGLEEPCTSEELQEYAKQNRLKFDMFAKVDVNCYDTIPLYKFLKYCLKGDKFGSVIKWNYTVFIVNRHGIPVERIEPRILPSDIETKIKFYLCRKRNLPPPLPTVIL